VRGVLTDADRAHVVVDAGDGTRAEVALDDVTQARTVFEWGPQPRPGSAGKGANAGAAGKTRARAKERR
jgi:hypothetical protein